MPARIIYSNVNPSIVYATTSNADLVNPSDTYGISTDGGITWIWKDITENTFGNIISSKNIEPDPFDPNEIWLVSPNSIGGGFYKSVDMGDTWNRIPIETDTGIYYNSVVQTKADRDLIILTSGALGDLTKALQLSNDNGITFTTVANGLPVSVIDRFTQYVQIDDQDPDVFSVNGYVSEDRGQTYNSRAISNYFDTLNGKWYYLANTFDSDNQIEVRMTLDQGRTFEVIVDSMYLGFDPDIFPALDVDVPSDRTYLITINNILYLYDRLSSALYKLKL